tara:strand:+ start:327 stop:815 length:489 start_codon:yes stop_codon:yes gene_type:complete
LVLPIIALVGGSLVGIGGQIALNKLTGQKTTQQDVVVGAVLGTIPGVGYIQHGSKIALTARHLVHIDRTVDTVGGIAMVMLQINKHNIGRIGAGAIRASVVRELIEYVIPEPKPGPLSETQSVPGSRNVRKRTQRKSKPNGSSMQYCKKHRKMDFCKRYNIS